MGRKRKPLPRMSEKARERAAARKVTVEIVRRRDNHTCQARGLVDSVRCGGPLDPHEIIPRSAWQLGYLEPGNVVTVCRRHHEWIDNHPDDAFALGLHGYSWQREDFGRCTQSRPCERLNPLHVSMYGQCWVRQVYSANPPKRHDITGV